MKNTLYNISGDTIIYSLTMDDVRSILESNLSEEDLDILNTIPEEELLRNFKAIFSYGDEVSDSIVTIASGLIEQKKCS